MIGQINNTFKTFLHNISTVYFHGSCPDGIGARQILKTFFSTDMIYIPYYFQELESVPANSLFIDCSPKNLRMVLENGGMIIEHHDSRKAELVELMNEYPHQILFGEGQESGTWLALQVSEFLEDDAEYRLYKEVAELIAISDTWQKDNPSFAYARMLAGYIAYFGNDFDLELYKLAEMEETIRQHGAVQDKLQMKYADHAIVFGNVAFMNSTNISNASEILRTRGIPLAVGWTVNADNKGVPKVYYSLRSDGRFDIGAFCKVNGGGGHKAAAGFQTEWVAGMDPISHCLTLLIKALQEDAEKQ